MEHKSISVIAILACVTSLPAVGTAQDACGLLLRAGINNVYTSSSDFRQRDVFFHNLCMRYENTVKKGVNFGSETFSAYGYNNLTLTATQAEAMARASCETTVTDVAVSNLRNVASTSLSAEALSAWTQCLDLTRQGFEIRPSFRSTQLGYGGHDEIHVQATFKSNVGSSLEGPVIRAVKGSGFKCTGSLIDAVGRRIDSNTTYALDCSRETSPTPFKLGDALVHAKAHSVSIDTSAGAIYLTEPEIQASPSIQQLAGRLAALETELKQQIAAVSAKIPTKIVISGTSADHLGWGNRDRHEHLCVGDNRVMIGGAIGTRSFDFSVACGRASLVP